MSISRKCTNCNKWLVGRECRYCSTVVAPKPKPVNARATEEDKPKDASYWLGAMTGQLPALTSTESAPALLRQHHGKLPAALPPPIADAAIVAKLENELSTETSTQTSSRPAAAAPSATASESPVFRRRPMSAAESAVGRRNVVLHRARIFESGRDSTSTETMTSSAPPVIQYEALPSATSAQRQRIEPAKELHALANENVALDRRNDASSNDTSTSSAAPTQLNRVRDIKELVDSVPGLSDLQRSDAEDSLLQRHSLYLETATKRALDELMEKMRPLVGEALQSVMKSAHTRIMELERRLQASTQIIEKVLDSKAEIEVQHRRDLRALADLAADEMVSTKKQALKWKKRALRKKEASELLNCVICLENQRSVIYSPCMHLCVCDECAEKCKEKCPMCNEAADGCTRVFIP